MRRLLFPLLFLSVILGALPASVSAAATPTTAKYLCLIVLDAGRPDYITNHLSQMPNMRNLLTQSRQYDRAWVGSLMSITPPDHAIIGTGSLPKDDGGIVNWDWGVHSTGKISPTFQAKANYQNGWAFKVIRDSGTPTLSGAIKQKYPNGLVIAGSGAHFHAAGPMGGPDASWIFSYDRTPKGLWAPYTLGQKPVPAKLLNDPSLSEKLTTSNGSSVPLTYDPVHLGDQDKLVTKFAIRSLELYKPRAMMLNLPEPDTVGHWSHQWKRDIGVVYRSFDKNLGSLLNAYKKAGIYDQTLFVVTADHGMIQSKTRVIDREGVINQIKTTLGHKSIILTNGGGTGGPTMTSIWLKNQANNARMAKLLYQKHWDNVSAIFYMDHSGGKYTYKMAGCESCSPDLEKAYTYLMNAQAGPTGEDIGILLRENARNSGLPQMLGRHGGADWGSQHITLVMSGPGVATGVSHHPARLTDLAPTIERFMGITPRARDGIVLADAFQSQNSADVTTQNTSDAVYSPMVNAISSRAQSDISLEVKGKLANHIPSDEIIIHWKRRWAVTIAGVAVLLTTIVGLGWAIAEVRRQGTGLTWTS
jgi:predicted AlkP superfamily pyrophosphatase or phosphodiesterase